MNKSLSVLLTVAFVALGAEAAPHLNGTTTPEENVIVPDPVCEPKPVYIKWDTVRAYLVHKGQANLPGSWVGQRLLVHRCLNFLNYCDSSSGYCGVSSQKEVIEKMKLTKDGHLIGYLWLEFVEDCECSCMTGDEYERKTNPVESIPPIYHFNITMNIEDNEI